MLVRFSSTHSICLYYHLKLWVRYQTVKKCTCCNFTLCFLSMACDRLVVFITNRTNTHVITEILKVALNTNNSNVENIALHVFLFCFTFSIRTIWFLGILYIKFICVYTYQMLFSLNIVKSRHIFLDFQVCLFLVRCIVDLVVYCMNYLFWLIVANFVIYQEWNVYTYFVFYRPWSNFLYTPQNLHLQIFNTYNRFFSSYRWNFF